MKKIDYIYISLLSVIIFLLILLVLRPTPKPPKPKRYSEVQCDLESYDKAANAYLSSAFPFVGRGLIKITRQLTQSFSDLIGVKCNQRLLEIL